MLASLNWIAELAAVDPDADRIAHALTARGLTVDAVDREAVAGDVVLDIDIPANRPDCLGHLGLAREVAAAFGSTLVPFPGFPAAAGEPVGSAVQVEVEAPDLCPRYTAGIVRGVRIGPSPEHVVRRLEACGLRSINNAVDASNLVMLGIGQPIHFFDLARVDDRRIVIRRGRPGEVMTTLDGIERKLDDEMTVIGCGSRADGLGGIMGGAATEVLPETTEILIEAASFLPTAIRRASRVLGLQTDASHRFERGVDPEAVLPAQAYAAWLLAELAGGVPAPDAIDVYSRPREAPQVAMRTSRAAILLGYDPGAGTVRDAFRALALPAEETDPGRFVVTVPSWRMDLEREADLVEEVARHVGYDRIPSTLPTCGQPAVEGSTHPLTERCREVLSHRGFAEAFNYAMIAPGDDDPFVPAGGRAPLPIANPISDQLAVLRRTAVPGLLQSVDRNLRRGNRNVRLFEVGRVFLAAADPGAFPEESMRAALAWTGTVRPPHWSDAAPDADLFDLAGVLDSLIEVLRPGLDLRRERSELAGVDPGRGIAWVVPGDGRIVAYAGVVHPELRARLDLPQDVMVAEIDLDALLACPGDRERHAPLPRVPSVTRDLSLVLAPGVSYRDILEILAPIEAPAPVTFGIVDRYEGKPLASGEVSLTIRVMLQPLERTLTDDRSEGYRQELIAALERSGKARLRG